MAVDILEELRRRHVVEPGPDAPVYITDSLMKPPTALEAPAELPRGYAGELWEGIKATPETALTLATGMASFMTGASAGVVSAPFVGVEKGAEIMERVQRMSYAPKSEVAQRSAEIASWPFEILRKVIEWPIDKTMGYFVERGMDENYAKSLTALMTAGAEVGLLTAGPKAIKSKLSRSSWLKLRRKLGRAERTKDFADPDLKIAIDDVLAEAKKDPATMTIVQQAIDEMSAGVMKDPTTAALDKIRAERAVEVKPVEPEVVPEIIPEEPRPAVPEVVEPPVKPVEPIVEPVVKPTAVVEPIVEAPKPLRREAAPPKPTPETQAAKYELEYKGSREEPTGIVHEYFDPQTGEHFVADSVKVVGKELEMHRRLVEERTIKYSDLTVADYAKLVDDWTAGRGDLDINVIKKELQDFIAEKPARDFATTPDRAEFISRGEELLGKINKRMKERGLIVEPIEEIIAERPEVVKTREVLEDGNASEPKELSGKDRMEYIRSAAEKKSKYKQGELEALIEEKVDISGNLPPEAQDAYRAYKDMQEMATESSEPRGVADIYRDLTEIFNERGEWTPKGRHLTHEQKMALQRLEADAKRLVGDLTEYLRGLGLDEKQILMAKRRLDEIRKIEPETSAEPRNTWIDAEAVGGGDKIVKQRKISRDRQAIPLYDSVVKMLQNARELRKSWFKFLDVPIRDFREAGLEPIHEAYRSVVHTAHEEAKVMRADVKELRRGVGWKSGKRIGAYAVGQQKRGRGILKKMGVEIPKLTEFEMRKYLELRDRFETFFDRIQNMRATIGKKPLEKVDNYFTFMRTFNVMDRLGIKSNILMDDPKVVAERYMKYGATKFRWGVHRVKTGAIPVELDPFRIYQNYAADAIHHLHLSPLIATVNELLGRLPDPTTGKMTWELKNHKPVLYKSLTGWNNYIAGKTPLDLGWVDKGINKLRRNLLYSILGGSVRSGLIQFTALKNTFVELGFTPTLKGITASIEDAVKFDGKNRKFALKHSKHLSVRSPELELAMNDIMGSIRGGKLGELQEIAGGASLKFLTLMDMETAIMTWSAAYKFGRSKKGGMLGREKAFNFADDVCTRTQASALPGDIAPIQRSALGGAFTTFQTFVINDWGFLTRDVLGIRNAKITNDVVLKKVVRMLIATTAFNILLEDVVGVHSPLPTPVRDLLESMRDKDKPIDTMLKVALGLTDQVPGMGGARYGKGIAGAPLETVNDFLTALQKKPLAPPLWEPTGKLLGVPATGQAAKMMKARKRGESPWGQLVGTYTRRPKGEESGLGGLGGLGSL